jgi:hypothetical protein
LTGGHVAFLFAAQEEDYIQRIHFPHGIPMGLFYDMAIPADHVWEWKILWDTRVRDGKEFDDFCSGVRMGNPEYVSVDEVKVCFEKKAGCALLLVGTGSWWEHYEGPKREYGELWTPFTIGNDVHFKVEFTLPAEVDYAPAPKEVRLCFRFRNSCSELYWDYSYAQILV